jgi:hypothetical protein
VATTVVLICAGGELPVDMEDPGAFGDPEDICRGGDGLMAVKTFRISDQDDANRNTNPEIATMKFDDKPLQVVSQTPVPADTDVVDAGVDTDGVDTEAEAKAGVFVCENTEACLKGAKIEATLTEESYQSYESLVLGEIETVDEDPYISWFVTSGDLGADRSRGAASDKVFSVTWHPPLIGGSFTLFAVAHDLRGGTSWKEYRIEARTSE